MPHSCKILLQHEGSGILLRKHSHAQHPEFNLACSSFHSSSLFASPSQSSSRGSHSFYSTSLPSLSVSGWLVVVRVARLSSLIQRSLPTQLPCPSISLQSLSSSVTHCLVNSKGILFTCASDDNRVTNYVIISL